MSTQKDPIVVECPLGTDFCLMSTQKDPIVVECPLGSSVYLAIQLSRHKTLADICRLLLVDTKDWERERFFVECPLRKTRYSLNVHLEAAYIWRFNLVDTKG
jgi:hypothetical protein